MTQLSEQGVKYVLQLFVAGGRPSSSEARANLIQICETYLTGRYQLEIIDVLEDYQAAVDNGIMLTPTLIKIMPAPRTAIIGSLNDVEKVLHALNVPRDL